MLVQALSNLTVAGPRRHGPACNPPLCRDRLRNERGRVFTGGADLLPADKSEDVGVDLVRMRGHASVREGRIGLELPLLKQLDRKRRAIGVGNDLVVLTVD